MKIFHMGIDATTLSFLEARGFIMETGDEIEDSEDLHEWVRGDEYEAIVINLDTTMWSIYAVRYLRSKHVRIPVISISSCTSSEDPFSEQRAAFLEQGGDDFMRSPVNPRELSASLRACSRRNYAQTSDIRTVVYGDAHIRVDLSLQRVTVNNQHVHLTGNEALVFFSLAASGRVMSKEQLLSSTRSAHEDMPEIKIVDVFVCKIRKKLREAHPHAGLAIETVWGRGYALISKGNMSDVA